MARAGLSMFHLQRSVSEPAERELPPEPEVSNAVVYHAPSSVMHVHRHLPPASTHHHLQTASSFSSHNRAASAMPATSAAAVTTAPSSSSAVSPSLPHRPTVPSSRTMVRRGSDVSNRRRGVNEETPPPSPKANRSRLNSHAIQIDDAGGDNAVSEPPNYLDQLSASFLERIPMSLKSSTRVLPPDSVLMTPINSRVSQAGIAMALGHNRGASIIGRPFGFAPAETQDAVTPSSQLSLSEMAEQARAVKRHIAEGVGTPQAGIRQMTRATISSITNPMSTRSRAGSIFSPGPASAAVAQAAAIQASAALRDMPVPHSPAVAATATTNTVAARDSTDSTDSEQIAAPSTNTAELNDLSSPSTLITPAAAAVDSIKAALAPDEPKIAIGADSPATSAAAAQITPAAVTIATKKISPGLPPSHPPASTEMSYLAQPPMSSRRSSSAADILAQPFRKPSAGDLVPPSPLHLPAQKQGTPTHAVSMDAHIPASLLQAASRLLHASTNATDAGPSSTRSDPSHAEKSFPPRSSSITQHVLHSPPTPNPFDVLYDYTQDQGSPINDDLADSAAAYGERRSEMDGNAIGEELERGYRARFPSARDRAASSSSSPRPASVEGAELSVAASDLGLLNTSQLDATSLQRAKDEVRVIEIFMEEMGAALFSCGLPMHVVEFYLTLVAHRLNIDLEIVAINTYFWISFPPSSTAHLVVSKRPGLSLSKMVDICSVCEHILHGLISPIEGLAQLQAISRQKSVWPAWLTVPSMAILCFFYAPLFAAGWTECFVAGIAGLLIGLLELYSENHSSLARGHDLICGALAGVLAIICHSYVTKINLLAAVFGGIVWCLPGLRVTMSMLDLSTGNPVSGTSKFMSSVITAVNLGIGVVAGISVGKLTGVDEENILNSSSYGSTPEWFLPICIIVTTFPSIVLLDAKLSHSIQYIFGSAAAFYLSSYAGEFVGQAFGSWLAAAGVGVIGNAYGRFSTYPSIELILFSIIMLVPGSIGVRSVLASDTISTISFLQQMITVAIAIVTGLFTANVLIPPLRVL